MAEERLQKFLAASGLCSRREAKNLMRQGRVFVNGEPAADVCRMFDPERSTVTVDGKAIGPAESLAYYMFHKPTGYVTTLSDPQGRPTVGLFLDRLKERVFPVGRLDRDVSGLLILTNDGDLCARLMHPSSLIPKVYRALLNGQPDDGDLELLREGKLTIEGKLAAKAKARMLDNGPDKGWLELTLTEGRKRQVKRMCAAIGHDIIRLKRVSYCGLWLPKELTAGQALRLTPQQVLHLREAVGLAPEM